MKTTASMASPASMASSPPPPRARRARTRHNATNKMAANDALPKNSFVDIALSFLVKSTCRADQLRSLPAVMGFVTGGATSTLYERDRWVASFGSVNRCRTTTVW